jgi:hypothetical protein
MKRIYILYLLVVFIFFMNGWVLSQEEEEFQWVWGEVISVDNANKSITIKYLDYETDTEKELSLIVDDKTKFEGVNSLAEIKVQDTISIDYIIEAGKNIARNISVEKLEDTVTESTPKKEYKQDQP